MPTAETIDLDVRRKRALFRAQHRGTKEMDWMIGRYAEAKLPLMNVAALERFELLLAVADPELDAWIFKPTAVVDPQFATLIADVRAFHKI